MSNHDTEPTAAPSPGATPTTDEVVAVNDETVPVKPPMRLSRAERNAAGTPLLDKNQKPDALRRSQTDGTVGRRRQRLRTASNDGSTGMFGEPVAPRRGRKRPTQMAEELQRSATAVANMEDLQNQLGDIKLGDEEEEETKVVENSNAATTPKSEPNLADSTATPTINEETPSSMDMSMPLNKEEVTAAAPAPAEPFNETAAAGPAEQPPPLQKEASKTEPSTSEQGPQDNDGGTAPPQSKNPLKCLACLFTGGLVLT